MIDGSENAIVSCLLNLKIPKLPLVQSTVITLLKNLELSFFFYWYNGDLASRFIASYRYLAINE